MITNRMVKAKEQVYRIENLEGNPRTCEHLVEVQVSGELICYFKKWLLDKWLVTWREKKVTFCFIPQTKVNSRETENLNVCNERMKQLEKNLNEYYCNLRFRAFTTGG